MASISGTVTIAGDPDDWIACAFDAATHAFAGVAVVTAGEYEITGLTAGKAYVVACRPKSGPAWAGSRVTAVNDFTVPVSPATTPYIFKSTSVSEGDANFSSVALLLHMDGPNNSITFTDVTGKTVTRNGDAKISTAQSKFGGSSAYLDGNGDWLSLASASAWNLNTNYWTIELWAYMESYPSFGPALISRRSTGTNGWSLEANNFRGNINSIWSDTHISWTKPSLGVWHHYALVKTLSTMTMYVDGSLVGSKTSITSIDDQAEPLRIGTATSSGENLFIGWIDDVRFTPGVARYTSGFDLPASAYPDRGSPLTGSTEPTWPTTPGNTTTDGDVTWTNMGQLLDPLIAGPLIAT